MATERDKGYAWIVATSSSLIMFIGPSTLASYGSIVETVDMSVDPRNWILNIMYILMFATAITIGPLIHIKCTYRKIALMGCLLSACGFLLTGTVLHSPSWLFITLSTLVGAGLGLAIHATFLLVAFHFSRYRGLANGIGLVSAGAGYLLSPLIYESIESAKDKLHLRALVSAVAFMAASFYLAPPATPSLAEKVSHHPPFSTTSIATRANKSSSGGSATGTCNSNNKASSKSSSEDEHNSLMRHGEFPRESIPLVAKDSDEVPPSHLLRPRRQSQFMIAIAETLLPNIPEESDESSIQTLEVAQVNNNSGPVSSDTPSPQSPPMQDDTRVEIGKHMSHLDLEVRLSNAINNTDEALKQQQQEQTQQLKPALNYGKPSPLIKSRSSPNMIRNNNNNNNNVPPLNMKAPRPSIRKLSYDQFRRSVFSKEQKAAALKHRGSTASTTSVVSMPRNNSSTERKSCAGIQWSSVVNFTLLRNLKFLNMALGCSLTMIVLPNFPIILYAHVTQSAAGGDDHERMRQGGLPGNDSGEVVLIIIFLLDLLSRLVVSYVSDFAFFNRRLGFLFGALSGAIVILGIGFIHDVRLIYLLAIIYGISFGTLVSTESLMFADVFGVDQLTSTYGFVCVFKAVLSAVTAIAFKSPFSSFLYTVHPILQSKINGTICTNSDPFELFTLSEEAHERAAHRQYLFCLIALPGFLCAIMWSLELLIHNYYRTKQNEAIEIAKKESNSSPEV